MMMMMITLAFDVFRVRNLSEMQYFQKYAHMQ